MPEALLSVRVLVRNGWGGLCFGARNNVGFERFIFPSSSSDDCASLAVIKDSSLEDMERYIGF